MITHPPTFPTQFIVDEKPETAIYGDSDDETVPTAEQTYIRVWTPVDSVPESSSDDFASDCEFSIYIWSQKKGA